MNQKITITFIIAILTLSACSDKRTRELQYMPDMYRPIPYEPYAESSVFNDSMEAQKPVKGTIARGQVPYEYPNTEAGYQDAKLNLKSPLTPYQINSESGKKLYNIYCATCHGKKGDGQGDLVKNEKFLGVPNYKDREITEGSIYHVIMHGRNLMGSHASQLTANERWQIVHYVNQLLKQ